jgi:hypothetical protein
MKALAPLLLAAATLPALGRPDRRWITAHKYKADRVVPYPFKDWKRLAPPKGPR